MTHYPAGHVSPAAFDNAQRNLLRQQIIRERDEAARAELEAEITRRLEVIRGVPGKPVAVQAAPRVVAIVGDDVKGEVSK